MATNYGKVFNIAPMDNIATLTTITIKPSRAWCDEVFFNNGCAHVNRPLEVPRFFLKDGILNFLEKQGRESEKQRIYWKR